MSDLVARAVEKLQDGLSWKNNPIPVTNGELRVLECREEVIALMEAVERVPDAIIIPEVREANERLACSIIGGGTNG